MDISQKEKKVVLSENEQEALVNLICFLFENENELRDIYDKVTMNEVVYYRSKNQEKRHIELIETD